MGIFAILRVFLRESKLIGIRHYLERASLETTIMDFFLGYVFGVEMWIQLLHWRGRNVQADDHDV